MNLNHGQFICRLRKFWFSGSRQECRWPLSVFSCCSLPDRTAFILTHTFWCALRQGCSSGDRVAEAWLCPSDSSLLCPLVCQSYSELCSLLHSSFFLSLICDMVGSALLSAYGLFAGVCVCVCMRAANFVWCTWACYLTTSLMRIL